MRPRLLLALAALVSAATAQNTPAPEAPPPPSSPISKDVLSEDPSVLRKRFEVDRIRIMVENGTLPKVRLEKAEVELLDAEDEALITRALVGRDITGAQAEEVVKAAQRRVDRRKKIAEEQQKLVDGGIISRAEMVASVDDVERAQKELDWATDRVRLVKQVENMAAAEAALMRQLETASPLEQRKLAEYFPGKGSFSPIDLQRVEMAFMARFAHPLPISANGETAVHRSLGFDHRGRVDVALKPDQPEGVWLRHYLTMNRIPFFAFRAAIAHKATGAHIHMGPPSGKYFAVASNSSGASH